MRTALVLVLATSLACGCSTARPRGGTATDSRPAGSAPEGVSVVNRPDERVQGKVVVANANLRYVVMDFPLRGMPALDQRLSLYRDGRKVGEVKISGPARDTTIAGDVMDGTAQVGDEVRED